MPLRQIELPELTTILQRVVAEAYSQNYAAGQIFDIMYQTGLRACEVLDKSRWTPDEFGGYTVQLSKGEDARTLPPEAVPVAAVARLNTAARFELETYASINNLFKKLAPVIYFNGDTRRTTLHCFRYHYLKTKAQEGGTVADIASFIGHKNNANTAKYINDQISAYLV